MPDKRLWMPRCRTCGPLGKPTGLDEAVTCCNRHTNQTKHQTAWYPTYAQIIVKGTSMTANDTSTIETTEAVNPDGELRQGLFAAQAARIVELQAEIASRQEEIDNLKSLILDSHPVGTYQAGNLKVQVKPGARRINAGTFEKAYPATKYPGAYQLRPRPLSQLEKLLSADAVADYAMSGKPTVVVS